MISIRKEKNKYLVRENRVIDHWSLEDSVEQVIRYLKEQAESLIDPYLSFDVSDGYYGDGPTLDVLMTGDRLATDKEIEAYEKKKARDDENARKRALNERQQKAEKKRKDDLKALERVRKNFPELLKDA